MNSPIGWIGGKRALRKEIIALFPQDGVSRYIEVFFGAGWVFFGREKRPASSKSSMTEMAKSSIYSVASSITELPFRKSWSGLFLHERYFSTPLLSCILMVSQISNAQHVFSTCSKPRLDAIKRLLLHQAKVS